LIYIHKNPLIKEGFFISDIFKSMRVFKNLNEGFDETGTPDMKYYAFDWDDNILEMPTKIILKDENGNEVPMSTEDFSTYRTKIGVKPFEYKGHTIVGFDKNAFKNFRVEGDKQFIKDSMIAETGPVWNDFVEAINGGSIFSIITARGHTPSVFNKIIYNYIMSNHNGIDKDQLVKNLEKYRDMSDMENTLEEEMIKEYLDMCKFYPVSYGSGVEVNPEEGKINALKEFIDYVKQISGFIQKKAFLKNKISNNFVLPQIGFSDDDPKNISKIKSHFKDKPDGEDILKIYSTTGGVKKLE